MCHSWENSLVINQFEGLDGFEVSRCCILKSKKISKEQFFGSSLNDVGKFAKPESFIQDDLSICSHDCNFLEDIDKIHLNIIHNCNLRCYHCCAGFDKDDPRLCFGLNKSLEYHQQKKEMFFQVLNYLKNYPLKTLSMDGSGEIFLYYKDLIHYLLSVRPHNVKEICFLTNGSLLTEEKIITLSRISEKTKIQYSFDLSIDGITKESFESIRHGAKFEQIIKTAYLLKDHFDTQINFTIKKPNIGDIDKVSDFFKDFRLFWSYDYYDPECAKYLKNKWGE